MSRRRAARINYQLFHTSGIREEQQPPTNTIQQAESDIESDHEAEKSTLEQTFSLYQSLYEDNNLNASSGSVDSEISSLVQGLSITELTMEGEQQYKQLSIEQSVIGSDRN